MFVLQVLNDMHNDALRGTTSRGYKREKKVSFLIIVLPTQAFPKLPS